MSKSALIIGIGGTGQWVLTHLKKDLLESNNGVMPSNVRLLCFDTMPQADAKVAAASGGGVSDDKKEIKVGSIRLEQQEFVQLGGKIVALTKAVADDLRRVDRGEEAKYAHLAWYRGDKWGDLPEASLNLETGAGQLRQLGRIALFNDLRNSNQSELLKSLRNAIEHVHSLRKGEPVQIFVVASFAGGTGSGLFIDIAMLVRHLAAPSIPKSVRGYFVLPQAFQSASANSDMMARSLAAWRELNRFMVVSEDFSMPGVVYNDSASGPLRIPKIDKRLFDTCYLVDGARGDAQNSANAENFTHPTIAAAISTIIDEKAGEYYIKSIEANLAPYYADVRNAGRPLYSAVGTHTYKVPVYYSQRDFTHKFTLGWLNRLVKPLEIDTQSDVLRVMRIDSTSPSDPTRVGRMDATVPLTSPQEYEGQSEAPTAFFGALNKILLSDDDAKLVESYAKGSTAGTAGETWLRTFPDLKDRRDIAAKVEIIRKEADLRVAEAVGTTEKNVDFPAHARNILAKWIPAHYGFRNTQGADVRGSFGDALDHCSEAQIGIFRRQLELWLIKTLMSGDKSGRIGYAWDLLDGLVIKLKSMDDFMDRVRKAREEKKPYLEAGRKRDLTQKEMDRLCNSWVVFGLIPHPKAKGAIAAYLRAEQAVVDARRDEILHDSVTVTVREMRKLAEHLKNEVDRWVRLLATGDPATGQTGLYARLDAQRRELGDTKKADEDLKAVQNRLGDLDYPAAEETNALKRLFDGIRWELKEGTLMFSIAAADEPVVAFEQPLSQQRAEAQASVTQRNLVALQSFATRRFSQLPESTQIGEQLLLAYGSANALATEMNSQAKPLFVPHAVDSGNEARASTLVRIKTDGVSDRVRNFLTGETGLEAELLKVSHNDSKGAQEQGSTIKVVGNENPHTCVIMNTQDLMQPEMFNAWDLCLKAFTDKENKKRFDSGLYHNFSAEANAAHYEERLSAKRSKEYRVFHPWVVMLLEKPRAFEHFFICRALGWIEVQNGDDGFCWELRVPGEDFIRLTPASRAETYSIFQAARYFVLEGTDQTPGSTKEIDHGVIARAIAEHAKDAGLRAWVDFLAKNCGTKQEGGRAWADGELMQVWTQHCKELEARQKGKETMPKGEPAQFTQAYRDLSDVVMLMFEERRERAELQTKYAQTGARPLPPPPAA